MTDNTQNINNTQPQAPIVPPVSEQPITKEEAQTLGGSCDNRYANMLGSSEERNAALAACNEAIVDTNVPLADDNFYTEHNVYTETRDAGVDSEQVQCAVGEVLAAMPAVLGLKGGLTDIFKDDDDLRRGISVQVTAYNDAKITAKLITDETYSTADVLAQATAKITEMLKSQFGLGLQKLDVQVAQSMSRAAFEKEYGKSRFI